MTLPVLIVDDSLTVRMDLADAFSAAGFQGGRDDGLLPPLMPSSSGWAVSACAAASNALIAAQDSDRSAVTGHRQSRPRPGS